jgi:hypothetical protein
MGHLRVAFFISEAQMAEINIRRGGKPIEAAEEYLAADKPISIDDIAAGVTPDIEVIDRPLSADKIENERFMAEKITVMVHESNDDADDDFVQTWVNGRIQMFRRGVPQDVKRCFVEALARAKRTTYKQNLDERLGTEKFNVLHPRTALHYPFSVLHDPSPKGQAWIKNVLAQRV